jgi:hypothetical protein
VVAAKKPTVPVAVLTCRKGLDKDCVAVLFENFLIFKALLDAVLCALLLAGQAPLAHLALAWRYDSDSCCEVPGMLVDPASLGCGVVGLFYQFEEIASLILMMRIAFHPYKYLILKDNCVQ